MTASEGRRSPGVLTPLQQGCSSLCGNQRLITKPSHCLQASESRQREGRGNPGQAQGNCLDREICGAVGLVCPSFAGLGVFHTVQPRWPVQGFDSCEPASNAGHGLCWSLAGLGSAARAGRSVCWGLELQICAGNSSSLARPWARAEQEQCD